ncbi:hypothetical protein PBI_MAHDIA_19 [Gordonia phage Mahdia]|uniref:Uncharacterized protein n=1 Tax=Gordonia phage Mahdia TaxID=2047873 RepID=A0A2H4P9W1_9CAUD|nr:hypothetical protein FDJ14_gp19 [Gordonia phage Mahdia]ATW59018.1 hypothetical protein PBI_MAHDIA_19 [Gordonia phage Mahdia]
MPYTNRHPSVSHFKPLFQYGHLPPDLQEISAASATLAEFAVHRLNDGPELAAGLRKLLEAKDCFVRQAVLDREEPADG